MLLLLLMLTLQPEISFHNCDYIDCYELLDSYIQNSSTIHCEFYRLLPTLAANISQRGTLVLDSRSGSLMHNKFCVFNNDTVWTGSFNPSGSYNSDAIVIVQDKRVAASYLALQKKPHKSRFIDVYRCPQHNCLSALQNELVKADESIEFALFSFTHPRIANELRLAHIRGVEVKGIVEKNNISQFATISLLNVQQHNTSRVYHHKLWIIDNKTLIIGSMNPTRNGVERNDENFVVIRNAQIAQRASQSIS